MLSLLTYLLVLVFWASSESLTFGGPISEADLPLKYTFSSHLNTWADIYKIAFLSICGWWRYCYQMTFLLSTPNFVFISSSPLLFLLYVFNFSLFTFIVFFFSIFGIALCFKNYIGVQKIGVGLHFHPTDFSKCFVSKYLFLKTPFFTNSCYRLHDR